MKPSKYAQNHFFYIVKILTVILVNIVYSNRSIYPKEVKALNIGTQLAFRTISTHEIISFLTATYLMEAKPVDIKTIFLYCENFHSEFSNIAHSND